MTSTPWTPGPWEIDTPGADSGSTRRIGPPLARFVALTSEGDDANARLISKAPDMAELLERLYERYGWEEIRTLLAYIRGEET